MTATFFEGPDGHGWVTELDGKEYWSGRGRSGYLLGPYVSEADCVSAVSHDTDQVTRTKYHLDLDRQMDAEALVEEYVKDLGNGYEIYRLLLDGKIVGFCVITPDGSISKIFGTPGPALAAAKVAKEKRDNAFKP